MPGTILKVVLVGIALAAAPGGALAQMSSSGGVGRMNYMFSGETFRLTGDTLRVRMGIVNGGDSAIAFAQQSCQLDVKTTLNLIPLSNARCSEIKPQITSGDSAWAELAWRIDSPPGNYTIELSWPGGGFGTSIILSARDSNANRPGRSPPRAAYLRLPIVFEFSNTSRLQVSADDVRDAALFIARIHGNYLPMAVTQRAAENMAGTAPYLRLQVHLTGEGQYSLSRCWIGASGRQLNESCGGATTGGAGNPVFLGAFLSVFMRRELEYRRRELF